MPSKRRSNVANARAGKQGRSLRGNEPLNSPCAHSAQVNDIIGVVLIALSVAMIIALTGVSQAPVTQATGEFLRLCFGAGALLCPLALLVFAVTFFVDDDSLISGHVAAGLALIVLAMLSLLSLIWPGAEASPDIILAPAIAAVRGGYVGGGIAWILLKSVGFGVGAVLLVCMVVVGLVVCGFSISGVVAKMKRHRIAAEAQKRAEGLQAEQLQNEDDEIAAEIPRDAAAAATTFLGARKTSVLRRGSTDAASQNAPTELLRRDKLAEPAKAGQDVSSATEMPTMLLHSDAKGVKQDDAHLKPSVTIPDFLKGQKEQAAAQPKAEPASAHESGVLPKKKEKPTIKASFAPRRPGDAVEGYELPPFSMLSSNPHSSKTASSDEELASTMRRLQATLEEFGLTSKVVNYVAGPLVTTFQVEMGEGERVNKIVNLEDDIALTLAAESVRIFAPIPGTSRVGIEIPNKRRENVHLGDVLPYAKGGPLEFAVGRDSEGRPVIADLAKMPHLLVAGATGSGKSVMINSLIMSILMRDTPKQVRLILVDPKRVEFSGYNGLPHLYVPVVTEPRQAASALQWAVSEMERRLKVFERAGARNIGAYNEMCVSGKLSKMDNPPEPMPFMVIIIDELSDLMMVAGKDVEASIVRIAQLARAAGIHLVLATQRPSADVVTGLIKSNIETRIALSVASSTDSRVIIDQTGAQRLLGNGDMLFKYRGHRTRRVLGCYVSDEEIESVVDFVRSQGKPDYHEEILTQVTPNAPDGKQAGAEDEDPLVWEAAQIVVESHLGSTSSLQRRLKVGYARAGRIMDMLEAKGIVGPPDGSKPREVLLDESGLEQLRSAEEKYREV
jgi:S-DNA-T family DNA segregation ATPase FtsK/SpoIIIE